MSDYLSNLKWRQNNPLAYSAHMILAAAIRSKKIEPQTCEQCNAKAHAHHEDYTEPLKVRWLCSKHHRVLHAIEKGHVLGGKQRKKEPTWPYRKHCVAAPKRDAGLEKAQLLRMMGMSYRLIGQSLGTSISQVYKWLNPKEYD